MSALPGHNPVREQPLKGGAPVCIRRSLDRFPPDQVNVLRASIHLLTRQRELTWELAKREVTDRHIGQVFGTFWTLGHPLFLMGLYVFIFAFVLKAKIGETNGLPSDYVAYILSGLIPWMAFQEAMSKSCSSILDNRSLVKQVVFPIEVLPVKGVVAVSMTQVIATCFLIGYMSIGQGRLPWTVALLPIAFAIQLLAMVGAAYMLAAVSVYFRDMKDVVQVFGVAGAYLMPIFYLPQWVPSVLEPILYLNPFSYMGWCYQDIFYFGRIAHPWAWVGFVLCALGAWYAGYRIFQHLRPSFGSVL
jgi:lipopolysaccharide transport system permease protein